MHIAKIISSMVKKILRLLKEEDIGSLFRKTNKKLNLYKLGKPPKKMEIEIEGTNVKEYPADLAKKWLHDNKNNFNNQFYILLRYLLSLHEHLKDAEPISSLEYENYFRERCIFDNIPFEVTPHPVREKGPIIEVINEFDRAYLDKMIQSIFIHLIGFLVKQKGSINLLDFGTGPTCGMYGENGRFLFEKGLVDINSVNFFAIDDIHKPQGAIFEKSTYKTCDILSFNTNKKFDLITGHHVIEHCYNWEDVILHLSKILNDGGYIYLSFPRFGGFYDTAYRLMSPLDHCAAFDINTLKDFSEKNGLHMCYRDIYVDPNNQFDWICKIYPELVNKEIAKCFYDLCVAIDSKTLLGYHHYGYYVILKKAAQI